MLLCEFDFFPWRSLLLMMMMTARWRQYRIGCITGLYQQSLDCICWCQIQFILIEYSRSDCILTWIATDSIDIAVVGHWPRCCLDIEFQWVFSVCWHFKAMQTICCKRNMGLSQMLFVKSFNIWVKLFSRKWDCGYYNMLTGWKAF